MTSQLINASFISFSRYEICRIQNMKFVVLTWNGLHLLLVFHIFSMQSSHSINSMFISTRTTNTVTILQTGVHCAQILRAWVRLLWIQAEMKLQPFCVARIRRPCKVHLAIIFEYFALFICILYYWTQIFKNM